jgi:hypothetical protein
MSVEYVESLAWPSHVTVGVYAHRILWPKPKDPNSLKYQRCVRLHRTTLRCPQHAQFGSFSPGSPFEDKSASMGTTVRTEFQRALLNRHWLLPRAIVLF